MAKNWRVEWRTRDAEGEALATSREQCRQIVRRFFGGGFKNHPAVRTEFDERIDGKPGIIWWRWR